MIKTGLERDEASSGANAGRARHERREVEEGLGDEEAALLRVDFEDPAEGAVPDVALQGPVDDEALREGPGAGAWGAA